MSGSTRAARWAIAGGALVLALAAASLARTRRPPDLIFVVLDTVRSASVSVCGYDRPTTPVLERLRDEGWSVTCAGVSPGTWTTPSHASFLTGWPVPEFEGGRRVPSPDETLPGQLAARAYQTVLVSGNMVLRKPDWMAGGFERSRIARDFDELDGEALSDAVAGELAAIDPTRPLFLFVNIADAHAPYPAIPDGIDWAPPQRPVQHRLWTDDTSAPLHRYVAGAMSEEDAARYRERLTNGYDHAVLQADRSLGALLDVLRDAGRLDDARVVVTSDHGEFVGEHGLVGHGETLFEAGVRVPVLAFDSRRALPPFPEPFSALHAHALLLSGTFPADATAASVVAHRPDAPKGYDGVAVWGAGDTKLLWREGTFERFDLAGDPTESAPLPVGDHPQRAELDALVGRHRVALDAPDTADHETIELLRAAGYVE